jgi:two-component system cell cycle response regulator
MKILLADDDRTSRKIVAEKLQEWGHEITEAVDGLQALQLLQRDQSPNIAILDWNMPSMDGLDLCRYVRANRKGHEYLYILILTGNKETHHLIEALDAGADDYIHKPCNTEELRARLRVAIRILELQNSLILKATHDTLSGLLNHGAIIEELGKELSRMRREKKPISVVLADLDHFKTINDTYGHQIGDYVLNEASRRMRVTLRCYDHLGRYGGDEFLIVLPGCSGFDAGRLAERIRNGVCFAPIQTPIGPITITLSIGATTTTHLERVTSESLIHSADEALYAAKKNGRNCVEVALIGDVTS